MLRQARSHAAPAVCKMQTTLKRATINGHDCCRSCSFSFRREDKEISFVRCVERRLINEVLSGERLPRFFLFVASFPPQQQKGLLRSALLFADTFIRHYEYVQRYSSIIETYPLTQEML